jgi:hypothetical protein
LARYAQTYLAQPVVEVMDRALDDRADAGRDQTDQMIQGFKIVR